MMLSGREQARQAAARWRKDQHDKAIERDIQQWTAEAQREIDRYGLPMGCDRAAYIANYVFVKRQQKHSKGFTVLHNLKDFFPNPPRRLL